MTDADTLTPTDAEIVALAYDCSALPECVTDATLLVFARDVLAKWGTPAPAIQPVAVPAGMEPYAQHAIWHEDNCTGLDWTQYHDASDPMPKTWDDEAPDVVVDLFTAAQVQAMLAAVPRNATLYNPDDVAFPVQRSADGVDALPPELASTSAAKKGGQHGTDT